MDRRNYLKAVTGAAATGIGLGALATPAAAITENQTGTDDGYFFSFWTNDEGSVTMDLEDDGSYSTEWSDTGNFVCGKGWETGGRKDVEYTAEFDPQGNSYLCLYGWTTDPLVEYYIIEDYGNYKPGDARQGSFETDGGTYEIYTSERVEKPSIVGTATFTQYWSIREDSRTSGTITTGDHFDAWEDQDMPMGDHDYMIMATEGYQSSGSSSVTVGESGGSDPTTTETTTTDEPETTTTDEPEGPDWPEGATDPDDDGLYEDLSGNEKVDFPDVNTLFQNADSAEVEDNVEFYDFDDDGSVDLQDVLALFDMV
ncbi:MAG: glycoside hydrolase family 11 protein [Halococcoides sp.]